MTTKAAAPFNGHRADVILRTTDNVDFHAHMNMLCVASPFFDQMFSLPQPPVIAQDGTSSPVPTIPLSEDSQTMDHLLRLCYPVAKPQPLKKLELVAKVLVAAMKYEFEEATVLMKTSFHSLIKSSPLEAYAISCRLKLEKEASLSAKAWKEKLKVDGALDAHPGTGTCSSTTLYRSRASADGTKGRLLPCSDPKCLHRKFKHTVIGRSYTTAMKDISAGCFFRLLRFLHGYTSTSFCDPAPTDHPQTTPKPSRPTTLVSPDLLLHCPADIILKSSDGVLIPTHRLLLAFAEAIPILTEAADSTCPLQGNVPVVGVNEKEKVLFSLLRMCQPQGLADDCGSFEEAYEVWQAAMNLGMTKVAQAAYNDVASHRDRAPVLAYLVSVQRGWDAEVRLTAERASRLSLLTAETYIPEMETASVDTLWDLYGYQHDHRDRAAIHFGDMTIN